MKRRKARALSVRLYCIRYYYYYYHCFVWFMHRLRWNLFICVYPQTNFSDVQSKRVAGRYARIHPFKYTYLRPYIDQVQQQLIIHAASIEIVFFFFSLFVHSFWTTWKACSSHRAYLKYFSIFNQLNFILFFQFDVCLSSTQSISLSLMMLNREWPWNVPNNNTYIQNPGEEEKKKKKIIIQIVPAIEFVRDARHLKRTKSDTTLWFFFSFF